MNTRTSSFSPALRLLSRVAAAVFGGPALASAALVFLGPVPHAGPAEAALGGMQFSFAVYTVAVVWAFAPVSLPRAWAGLLLPAVVLAGLGLALRGRGGGG
mgnify:CR=1 FL=1